MNRAWSAWSGHANPQPKRHNLGKRPLLLYLWIVAATIRGALRCNQLFGASTIAIDRDTSQTDFYGALPYCCAQALVVRLCTPPPSSDPCVTAQLLAALKQLTEQVEVRLGDMCGDLCVRSQTCGQAGKQQTRNRRL